MNLRRSIPIKLLLLAWSALCGAISVRSQLLHPAQPMPGFAVISIRPSSDKDEFPRESIHPDSYIVHATPIRMLISYAYGIGYDAEIVGAPAWLSSTRYDVEAKLDPSQVAAFSKLSRDNREQQMRLMVQSLLAERFHLKVSFQIKKLPVYELVVAKTGLKCPVDTTSPPAIPNPDRPRFRWSNLPPPPPPPPGYVPPSPEEAKVRFQSLHMRSMGWPFWLLVTFVSHQPELNGRPVLDKTDLDGSYDCTLVWSPAGSNGSDASFFTAIQDQLGLKLIPAKGPVEVLVIEHIDHPTEN